MVPSNQPKRIRPFLELLVRSTVAFPLCFVLMVLWLGAACAMVLLPLIGFLNIFYAGDWSGGTVYLVGGIAALVIWRFLTRKVWGNSKLLV
jgi:hypothetical protein